MDRESWSGSRRKLRSGEARSGEGGRQGSAPATSRLRGASCGAAAVLVALSCLAAGEPSNPGAPDPALYATESLPAYGLGEEIIPNGDFDPVAPLWRQLRPDEGEHLAVVPEGWHVGHQGGLLRMPIPGVDPETHDRCMVFLHGAGRMDLVSPSMTLEGAGAYLLSMRIRSVVHPSPAVLRAVLRVTGAIGSPLPVERTVERWFPAGPEPRIWGRWSAVVGIPPGAEQAELHLIKEDADADFLVDDVSLKRIESIPGEIRLSPPARGGWVSPVIYLGALQALALAAGPEEEIQIRLGTTAQPGEAWTDWRPVARNPKAGTRTALPLIARGVPIWIQTRLEDPGAPRPAGDIILRAEPWKGEALSPEVSLVEIPRIAAGELGGGRGMKEPGNRALKEGDHPDRDREASDSSDDSIRIEIEASGAERLGLAFSHAMADFSRYEIRFTEEGPWSPSEGRFAWPLAPGENHFEVRARDGSGHRGPASRIRAARWISPGERNRPYAGLRALGGDPHVHTGLAIYSILDPGRPLATGDPAKVFESSRANGLQWAALTDYAQSIDDPRSLASRKAPERHLVNSDGSRTASEWEHAKAVVEATDRPGEFAAFLGVEFDGGGYRSKGGTGRKLILLPDTKAATWCSSHVFNVGDCPVVEDAFRYARDHGGVMIAASPCAASGGEDTDWSRHDSVVALLEIQGGLCERGPGGFVDVTSRLGLRVGAGGGSKNRASEAGLHDRTICWAAEIGRGAILEAIRERRCYWSAAGHLDLAFTLNGAVMGREAAPGAATSWSISATNLSAPSFHTVEILRDGEVIASAPCSSDSRCFLEGGMGRPEPGAWYAAINDEEGLRIAITSPVFVAEEAPR